ncbi:MAG: sporulation protein [Bacteroidota bacterium]
MLRKVKKWLGIEGVKLELLIPGEIDRSANQVVGKVRLYSMNTQTVRQIAIKFVERYSRGRKKERMTDEYQLGEIYLEQNIEVPANEAIEIDFVLPFVLVKSEMDELQDKNILIGGIVKAAKWASAVESEFRIEAEADVRGTALNPFDKKLILLK